jgi:hypothetical protein
MQLIKAAMVSLGKGKRESEFTVYSLLFTVNSIDHFLHGGWPEEKVVGDHSQKETVPQMRDGFFD